MDRVAAGGDLLEIDLVTGAVTDRTSDRAPLVLGRAGLWLHAEWGVGAGPEGVLRFERTPFAIAQPVPLQPPAAHRTGEVVASRNREWAATTAGESPTRLYPYVFGRGFEEVLACAEAGVPVTVVPGVTSAFAAPAVADVPVSHRGVAHEIVVVSGHVAPGDPRSLVDWAALGRLRGTIVLLMAVERIGAFATALMDGGRVVALGTPREVLTASIVARVYGERVAVIPHPDTGAPIVVPAFPEEAR